MTAVSETAYPQLAAEPKPTELVAYYTPTDNEIRWAKGRATSPLRRLGLLALLKCTQRLGYFPMLRDVPSVYLDHIKEAAGFARTLTTEHIKTLEHKDTRSELMGILRRRLHIRPLEDKGWLLAKAEQAAVIQHYVPDIINILLEHLVHGRYELPGFSLLVRTAGQARETVDQRHYGEISDKLADADKKRIDALFKVDGDATSSTWNSLKAEPGKPTNKGMRDYLEHVRKLQDLSAGLPAVGSIPVAKLRHYRNLARAQNAAEMAELTPDKRHALAVIFIRSCQSRTLDEAGDLYIKGLDRGQAAAKRRLAAFTADRTDIVDTLVDRFHETLLAYKGDGSATRRMEQIDNILDEDAEKLIKWCEEHLEFANDNYLPFLPAFYSASRAILFNCLDIIKPKSTTAGSTTERLIEALLKMRKARGDVIDLEKVGLNSGSDLTWLSSAWRKLIFGSTEKPISSGTVSRRFLEIAIHHRIRDELRTGDLYIERGERFDDYREQLVDTETFQNELKEYGKVTGIPVDAKAFTKQLKAELTRRAEEVDKRFPINSHASIEDGRLSLSRLPKSAIPAEAEKLDLTIRERLEPISILDILGDVDHWLDIYRLFPPLAGTQTRLQDWRQRFITTLLCYGCNLGATQTARSIKKFSRRQISWLNLKYITEEALDKAIAKVTTAYAKFELTGYFGSGKTASADGMKWNLYERNMFSEYHIRYGGYGGIGYYHVADNYIAFFSRFIPCGVYEGNYILDGLINNESEVRPGTMYGDTHAQNLSVFALSHLLGIKLMPRIRGIHKLHFFRPSKRSRYRHIDDLFGSAINWRLIQEHFNEMMRVVVSIKLGKITASTILRRFGNNNQSKLAMAMRELGKAIRTLFLLDYVETAELRKLISAGTNKSEAFNNFIQWVFFGDEGIIQENVAHEQRKLIKYSHLVANMLCLHNVQGMTKVIRQLRSEGAYITPEMLSYLSPYRTWHINRFGDYVLDDQRSGPPMEAGLKLFA